MNRTKGTEQAALVAAGATMLLWASAFVAIRAAAPYFSPGALALGRMLVASVVLGAILLIRREGWPSRAAWPGIIASGVLWFGLYMVTLNWGEESVDAGTAALIMGVGPILIALLSARLLHERITRFLLIGLAVSFAGTAVIGISVSDGGGSSVAGMLLCLVAAAAFACGVVAQKPALRHASAVQVTTFGCVVASVACLPFAGQLVTEVGAAPAPAVLNMVYLGLFPTALAFTTWGYALHRLRAGTLGATTYVVPVLVVALSWIVLREVPGALTVAGGLLCLAGVAVSRMRDRQPAPAVRQPERPAAPVASVDKG
ncbi:MAG TPA: DMT family transporter [Actinophytocola sp.]|uniref:DMT family transporter n=1 Tax=Actinophytocola sp. TaxID=1872138 RepID=UPI002DB84820|nr:DMT family transporter [Actinophytocola sp.]HEU5470221.1 DMT family transporter [Actinophytocola sp.]